MKKIREWLNVQLVKNPGRMVLLSIFLFDILFFLLSAFVIRGLAADGNEKMTIFEAVFCTVTMILDAGCIQFVVPDVSTAGYAVVIICLIIVVIIAYPASSREVQYDIPDSVTMISDWAFCECKKLNRITIPDSVYEIGEGAFCNCILLDEVEIPDSVTVIDDCAFRGCVSLEKVIVPSSVTELGWGLFDGCEKIVTVYCDENSAVQNYCIRNGIKEARISERDAD